VSNPSFVTFNMAQVLKAHAARQRDRGKRVRTRAQILAAAAREMELAGYEALTVERIANASGMAHGTFYRYFDNRSDVASAIIKRYMALVRRNRPRASKAQTPFQTIHAYNRYYTANYIANAAMLRGREALMREAPELMKERDVVNDRWARIVLRDLARRRDMPPGSTEDPFAKLAVRSAIAMVDELLREIYVYKSPSLSRLVDSEEQVAELISFMWFRAIFGETPPLNELKWAKTFGANFLDR
jgi:AcrR family transcriptional regulator